MVVPQSHKREVIVSLNKYLLSQTCKKSQFEMYILIGTHLAVTLSVQSDLCSWFSANPPTAVRVQLPVSLSSLQFKDKTRINIDIIIEINLSFVMLR